MILQHEESKNIYINTLSCIWKLVVGGAHEGKKTRGRCYEALLRNVDFLNNLFVL